MSFSGVDLGLKDLLHDPKRRQEFFKAIVQDEVASQIRSLRKARDLNQIELAEQTGMKQSAVSRIEQAEYSSWTLTTLLRVAAALDARWRLILEPCEDAIKEYLNLELDAQASLPTSEETELAPAFEIMPFNTLNALTHYPTSTGPWSSFTLTDTIAGMQLAFSAPQISQKVKSNDHEKQRLLKMIKDLQAANSNLEHEVLVLKASVPAQEVGYEEENLPPSVPNFIAIWQNQKGFQI